MFYALVIALHAAAGVVAFASGCLVIARRSCFSVYLGSLVALVVFLAIGVGLDWTALGTPIRVVFTALTALGAYLVWQGLQARRLLPERDTDSVARLIDHVGFTLVAMFVGFDVILALSAGAPGWLLVVIGVASVAAGHVVLVRVKSGAAREPSLSQQPV